MKNIFILGGGFAGIAAIQVLIKNLAKSQANITLIDQNSYHVFNSALYEVASSEEPQRNIAIPLYVIFSNKLNLVIDKIESIDFASQKVLLQNHNDIPWDYLAVCLGSETNFFAIPGLAKYSIGLKKLSDAVRIKDKINKLYNQRFNRNKKIQLIIGGGGFSGVELAAELANSAHANLIEISIIEAKNKLLNNLDQNVSNIAEKRLQTYGVKLIFNCMIKRVTKSFMETVSGQKYPFDLLIWTGGIRANHIISESGFRTNINGQVRVNKYMQVEAWDNIFAAGDCAEIIVEETKKPAPGLATLARKQGKIVGENICNLIGGSKLRTYQFKHHEFLIPLGGRFVIASLNFTMIIGFWAWMWQQFVFLRYLLEILPITKAFKKWNKFERGLKVN